MGRRATFTQAELERAMRAAAAQAHGTIMQLSDGLGIRTADRVAAEIRAIAEQEGK